MSWRLAALPLGVTLRGASGSTLGPGVGATLVVGVTAGGSALVLVAAGGDDGLTAGGRFGRLSTITGPFAGTGASFLGVTIGAGAGVGGCFRSTRLVTTVDVSCGMADEVPGLAELGGNAGGAGGRAGVEAATVLSGNSSPRLISRLLRFPARSVTLTRTG